MKASHEFEVSFEDPTNEENHNLWFEKLPAKTFESGLLLRNRYIDNAKENAAKAGFVSGDPDRFEDTKYSSIAGQYAYLALLIFLQGVLSQYPLDAVNWEAIGGIFKLYLLKWAL